MTAQERAIELMTLAAKYIREYHDHGEILYDGVICDGACLADDLDAAVEELDGPWSMIHDL